MVDLVTGGTGFLGVHLVEALVAAGREVVVAARRSPEEAGVTLPDGVGFRRTKAWPLPGGELGPEHLGQPGDLDGYERVFHLAALSRADEAEADPKRAFGTNVDWAGNLARVAAGRALFVHVSTDLVFGAEPARDAGGYHACEPTAAMGTYGRSKAAGEVAVRVANQGAHIVRVPLMFGDSRGRGLGAGDSLLAALDAGRTPGLFEDEFRTALDVRAAARALAALAHGLEDGHEADAPGEVWHLGGPRRSRLELGRALVAAAGRDPAALRATTRAAAGLELVRAADASLDSTKARTRFPRVAAELDAGAPPAFPASLPPSRP